MLTLEDLKLIKDLIRRRDELDTLEGTITEIMEYLYPTPLLVTEVEQIEL